MIEPGTTCWIVWVDYENPLDSGIQKAVVVSYSVIHKSYKIANAGYYVDERKVFSTEQAAKDCMRVFLDEQIDECTALRDKIC